MFEWRVFEIPDEQLDPECPTKYSVEICFKKGREPNASADTGEAPGSQS